MCGISGEVRFDGSHADIASVARMTGRLAARGPDAAGYAAQGRAALGHRRLKIIDLSERAQQPMVDSELGLTLAFNGCIYNYQTLRKELEGLGYRFFSEGDTEVVLKAWHAWGIDAPKRFYGMFAFAVLERETGRLALARDRLGIKPLYLAEKPGRMLRFASSLPALLAAGDVDTSIDPVALHHYMTFHAVVPAPFTILNGIKKMPPATVAVFEPDGRRTNHVYWTVDYDRSAADVETEASVWEERVHASLKTAVERRMVADVPVGVLLSGGLDSSLIVALLAEAGQTGLKTFSIGFEEANGEKGDEFVYSDLIARHFGTEHYKIFVRSKRLLDALPKAIDAMSEPMVSYDNVGFFLLSEEVSQHVRVVQSGQGADEVFGGYHWYPPLLDSNDPVRDYARVFFDRDHAEYLQAINSAYATEDYSTAFVAGHFGLPGASKAVDKALRLDSLVMLVDDPVKRVDNMTMAWGLEARVPFLDHDILELAARIPPEQKLRDGGKGILKDVGRKLLPHEVIDRPKGYFPVPALKYIEGPYLEMVRDILHGSRARERGLFQRDYVDQLLNDPKGHITPLRGSKLWQVALLEMWLQQHNL
ncbi:N-acetylglutaminylglutamine amidotransferase [uncultured Ferrovibrio sp.]|jgi:asparagine synthase (glutamine-hydrolysing)|uniref:N-acetylglutaminylglutamine amidotransferase n=1 Tax=uncultured Ferrovibrio sp. TaxID=1576913 RepID=UPI00260B5DBD|nr:N-acetylglutaminylglutamine amidotransferase [uncultured Ferrovibrio sp.]